MKSVVVEVVAAAAAATMAMVGSRQVVASPWSCVGFLRVHTAAETKSFQSLFMCVRNSS